MKMLRCVVQPYKLEDLKTALEDMGVQGMTVYEVKGHGRQKGHKEIYRGSEYHVSFLPKMMVEVAIASERVEEAIKVITSTLRSGQIGDGKIFVSALEEVVRIRTGERGEEAL